MTTPTPPPGDPMQYPQYNTTPPSRPGWVIPTIVGAIVVLLLLVAGGVYLATKDDDTPAPTPTVAVPPPTTAAPPPTTTEPVPTETETVDPTESTRTGPGPGERASTRAEAVFVQAVRTRPSFQTRTAQQLLVAGYGVCSRFDQGRTFEEVFNEMLRNVPNPTTQQAQDAGYFIGASVGALCPRNRDSIPTGSNAKVPV